MEFITTAGSDLRCPYAPSPDWAETNVLKNLIYAMEPVSLLEEMQSLRSARLGQVSLDTYLSVTDLGHFTNFCNAGKIECGVLEAGRKSGACFALQNPSSSSLVNGFRTCAIGDTIVPISGKACQAFRPIPAVGPISAWTRLCGGRMAPFSSVCLRTGVTTPGCTSTLLDTR